jgi:ubiquinone/menaquinone biosynthesis C-methylase UbiE
LKKLKGLGGGVKVADKAETSILRVVLHLQENIYNTQAPEKDEFKDLKVRGIIRELSAARTCKILDVGCGDGSLLEPFHRHHECYGVDISEAQLKKARAKGIKAFRVNIEAEKLPFPQSFFDLAVCSETIEHLLDVDNLFHEVNRTLKKGGFFILTFPNVNQPVSWLLQVVFDLPPMYSARYKSPHVRDYTLRIVKSALTRFGFAVKNVTGTYVYPFKGGVSQFLARFIPRIAEKIIVVSEKHQETMMLPSRKVVWNVLDLVREGI